VGELDLERQAGCVGLLARSVLRAFAADRFAHRCGKPVPTWLTKFLHCVVCEVNELMHVCVPGLAMPESLRWHDGRLWFSNWGTR
jgi:hypothetical protein